MAAHTGCISRRRRARRLRTQQRPSQLIQRHGEQCIHLGVKHGQPRVCAQQDDQARAGHAALRPARRRPTTRVRVRVFIDSPPRLSAAVGVRALAAAARADKRRARSRAKVAVAGVGCRCLGRCPVVRARGGWTRELSHHPWACRSARRCRRRCWWERCCPTQLCGGAALVPALGRQRRPPPSGRAQGRTLGQHAAG